MKTIIAGLVALFLVSGAAGAAMAAGTDAATPEDAFGLRQSLARTILELDLTDAQKTQAARILKANGLEARTRFEELRDALAGLRAAIRETPRDEAAVRAAFRRAAAAGEELTVIRGRIMADIEDILTPNQRETLDARRKVMDAKIRDRIDAGRTLVQEWIAMRAGQ